MPSSDYGAGSGEAEHLFGDDVALHGERAAADRQRRCEQESVVPDRVDVGELAVRAAGEVDVGRARTGPFGKHSDRARAVEHAGRAGELFGQRHHVLTVLVAHDLLDRRLGARSATLDAGGQRAQPVEPQHLGLDMEGSRLLALAIVGQAACGDDQSQQVGGGWPSTPQ